MNHTQAFFVVILLLAASHVAAQAPQPLEISGYVVIADYADVPARDAGPLSEISVKPGDAVRADQTLGKLVDDEARLNLARAKIDLEIATINLTQDTTVAAAQTQLREAESAAARAEIQLAIARRLSENDVNVRNATKARDTAQANLDRAARSRQKVKSSVSRSEIDRLTLIVQQHALEIEKARFELANNVLRQKQQTNAVNEANAAVGRSKLAVQQAQSELAAQKRNLDRFRNALQLAEVGLQRRQLRSPLTGIVEKVHFRKGEWLVPGNPVIRIVNLKHLFAEGYVSVTDGATLENRTARIRSNTSGKTQTATGKIIFVSREASRSDGRVLVRAKFPNPDSTFTPGMKIRIRIEPQATSR